LQKQHFKRPLTILFLGFAFIYIQKASSELVSINNYNIQKGSEEKLYKADEVPHPLIDIQVKEKKGDFIDLDLEFTDERDSSQSLRKYFKDQAVLMTVVYYNCPSLCNFHLNGLWTALNQLKNYQFVVVSMDSSENSDLALKKKQNYLKEFPKVLADQIHFLTGKKESIQKLTQSLGFSFRWDEETQQFAHSPVAYILSPEGMISRYLYGVEFSPQTLKLALLEARRGKIGNVIDRILLFCYRFNPKTNEYTIYAKNIMKAGGILTMLLLIALIVPVWLRERRRNS